MRFLIIDDSPYDRELIIRKLQSQFSDASFVEIYRRADYEMAVAQQGFDIVILDYGMKWANGLAILKELKEQFPDVPIVMATDTGNEEIAVEGMKVGLSDYVLKRHLQRLPFAVRESLALCRLRREQKVVEEQTRQAQKMESLGLLVGGIAHDFNNMLSGITGYAQLGLLRVKQDEELYVYLNHIREIAKRATRMTQQLLTFSRQQPHEPSNINLNTVISSLLDLLKLFLTEYIDLEFVADPALKTISVDVGQIEQVLINLCINARDAMPNGGKLLIRLQNIVLDEGNAGGYLGARPAGTYVLLTVTDTGEGIDTQVRERMFEPFFTTKELGKGTGLGLSVVHGIIARHHGFIVVDSEMGKGTTFNIYFPAVDHVAVVQTETEEVQGVQGGTETILVVEDDPDVRVLMKDVLEEYGYNLIMAQDGEEGLKLFEEHAATIALVIADLMMPKMKGRELYERIRSVSTTVRFLLVSGYRANQLDEDFVRSEGVEFLEKPFDLDDLAAKLHKILA